MKMKPELERSLRAISKEVSKWPKSKRSVYPVYAETICGDTIITHYEDSDGKKVNS